VPGNLSPNPLLYTFDIPQYIIIPESYHADVNISEIAIATGVAPLSTCIAMLPSINFDG